MSLSFYRDLTSLDRVFINDKLESAIFIILKVFEPIMKVVPKSLIWLNQMFWHTIIPSLGSASFSRIYLIWVIITYIRCLLAVRTFLRFEA